jgi:NTP pyrophosphatase (non-canonical NTP hydrolase)
MTKRDMIINEVHNERDRQDAKFGDQISNTAQEWLVILVEEVGEVARALCDGNMASYRKEIIEVAAVAVSMAESFDRRTDRMIADLELRNGK